MLKCAIFQPSKLRCAVVVFTLYSVYSKIINLYT